LASYSQSHKMKKHQVTEETTTNHSIYLQKGRCFWKQWKWTVLWKKQNTFSTNN